MLSRQIATTARCRAISFSAGLSCPSCAPSTANREKFKKSALTAAQTALAALQAAPKQIQQHISIDIALHYGNVAYGNIGSGNRLDFTAVGRDVNILSRLELLCKDVGRPLLMTDTFAVEVAEPVIEIGHFELRGFRRHQAVYALCQEGEQPCRPKPSLARA